MFGSIFTNFISTFFGVLIAFGITFFFMIDGKKETRKCKK